MTRRLHAIDWLRVLSVLAVFFFHVTHIFDFDLEGSVRNAETSLGASVYVFFVMQWSMPLLFLLAGVSSGFSLRNRSAPAFLHERAQRLLTPLLFGTVILIPWNGYMSALNHGTFAGPYWRFLPVHASRTWESLATPEAHHGLIALYYTSWHLWFLGYLLIFSAVALFWRHSAPRLRPLAALVAHPLGLLAFVAPIVLVRITLTARFPAYLDWSDTFVYLIAYFYGWLFLTDDRFLRAVERQAIVWLAVGGVCFTAMLSTYALGYLPRWLADPAYTPDYLLYQLLAALNLWAWVLALVGCGLRWLNFENAVLRYASEAALPFYVLHQVAVLTAGTIVVQWQAGVALKMAAISGLSFVATILIYHLAVRRSRRLRPLFGLKGLAPVTGMRRAVETP